MRLAETLGRAFGDCARLFRGDYPGYRACDTAYHNLQHTLDVALAMARLMDGYDRSAGRAEPIGARLFRFGIITALLHDVGYLRHRHDTRHQNGAEYTLSHVSRGSRFVEHYMSRLGMSDLAPVAAKHHPLHRLRDVGGHASKSRARCSAGSATCSAPRTSSPRWRTAATWRSAATGCSRSSWPGGSPPTASPTPQGVRFSSPQDLLCKTPAFYSIAKHRLNELLGRRLRVRGSALRRAEPLSRRGDEEHPARRAGRREGRCHGAAAAQSPSARAVRRVCRAPARAALHAA